MSLALAFVTDCHLDVTLTPASAKVEIDGLQRPSKRLKWGRVPWLRLPRLQGFRWRIRVIWILDRQLTFNILD